MTKRGAPPGNLNALKHGFYSRSFPKTDLRDLEAIDDQGLNEEISLLRLHLRYLTTQAKAAPTIAEYLDIMRVINLTLANLNRLVKTQVYLTGQAPATMHWADKILSDAQDEWTVDPPPENPN